MLLDVHTHLDDYVGIYLNTAVEQIKQYKIISISNSRSFASYRNNVEIAKMSRFIIPIFGIHPLEAHHFRGMETEIRQAVRSSLFLGEIGLDYTVVKDPNKQEAQREVLEILLDEAAKQKKLVIVHSRGAEDDVLKMLRHYNVRRVIIHWYSGPIDTYTKLVDEGYKFSIGFMVMHSDFIRVIARRIPMEQILIETDNPGGYESKHKKPGMPGLTKNVIREIGRLRNISSHEVEQKTWENFMNMLTPSERSAIIRQVERKTEIGE